MRVSREMDWLSISKFLKVGISLKFRSFSETLVAMGAKKIVVVPFREAKIFDLNAGQRGTVQDTVQHTLPQAARHIEV